MIISLRKIINNAGPDSKKINYFVNLSKKNSIIF